MATSFSVSGKLASTKGAVRNPASVGHPGGLELNNTRFRCAAGLSALLVRTVL